MKECLCFFSKTELVGYGHVTAFKNRLYTVKKHFDIPVPSRDVAYQTLPRRDYFICDVIIPAKGEFGK
jgi:hypothetical protein